MPLDYRKKDVFEKQSLIEKKLVGGVGQVSIPFMENIFGPSRRNGEASISVLQESKQAMAAKVKMSWAAAAAATVCSSRDWKIGHSA